MMRKSKTVKPKKPETQALGLRLPVALAERVRAAADANGRTWNAQVVHLIEAGFDGDAKARTTVAEAWGDSLARSAAMAAADAARDAVLRVARQFDDSLAEAKVRDAVLRVTHEAEQTDKPKRAERRGNADRRTHDDVKPDADPDLPLPAGTPTTDVYQVKGGFKVGRRRGERRADGSP
jgi:hypothetical protein